MRNALKVTTPSDREIVITREFNAPRELVWGTMTDPELIKRWVSGPAGWSMVSCENDARVGRTFRWVLRAPDGNEMTLSGVYREVVPPERIVRSETCEFGGVAQGDGQMATLVLADHGETTSLTLTLLYPSKEARDAALAAGAADLTAAYERVDEVLSGSAV